MWTRIVAAGIVLCDERWPVESGRWRLRSRNARTEPASPLRFPSCLVVLVHGVAWLPDVDRGIESPQDQSPAPGLGHIEVRATLGGRGPQQ